MASSGQFIDSPNPAKAAPRWDMIGYLLGNKNVESPVTNNQLVSALATLVGGAPASADTLGELATRLVAVETLLQQILTSGANLPPAAGASLFPATFPLTLA